MIALPRMCGISKPLIIRGLALSLLILFSINEQSLGQRAKYINEFLNLGVGARSMGMGGAVVASTSDATSGYWNPAGLASNYHARQLVLMHADYFSGLANYDYISLGMRLNHDNALGFTVLRFAVDDIPNTLDLIDNAGNIRYDRISTFSASDQAFMFSYGRQTADESFKFGASVKLIRRIVGDFASAWGFGADVGFQKHVKTWHFGLMMKDITTTFNVWNYNNDLLLETFTRTGNLIPERSVELARPTFILGVGKEQQIKGLLSVLVEANLLMATDGMRNTLLSGSTLSFAPSLGIELDYDNRFFFRFGMDNFQDEELRNEGGFRYRPALGAGVKLNRLSLDYALSDIGDKSQSNMSNIFSIKFEFNKLKF